MGINFLPYGVFHSMLFADNTFYCVKTGKVNFDSDLFLDILLYADSMPDDRQARWIEAMQTGEAFNPISFMQRDEQLMTNMFGFLTVDEFRKFDAAVGGLTPIGAPNAEGELSISTSPIIRLGIRGNSQNAAAAWEFIRLAVLYPNSSGIQGYPILRSLFEDDINASLNAGSHEAGDFFDFANGLEIPEFTEEKAAVLRTIMESITHDYHPNPHIMAIVWEEATAFFEGARTAEDTARIIQSRVSRYISELN
jgi:hypothetical protein